MSPSRTNHDRYVRGIGRIIEDAKIEVAGRNCGPQIADHHFPQSSSFSLRIMAGETIAEMNAGARIRAENKSNSESEIFVLPTIEYDSSSDKIAGVALPIVSTGFLRSIETPHEKNDLILSLDVTTDNFLSFNPLISIWFFVSEILPHLPSGFLLSKK